jgi:two-component sensor histidine kinase
MTHEDAVEIFGRSRFNKTASIMVPAPSVQPLGLAMHELAANAAVHGSLSHPGGRLAITWRQAEDNGLIFEWHEQGGRENNAAPRQSFGTVLLGAVLEKQLGGQIKRHWPDKGLHIIVELPSLNRVGANLKSKP